MRNTKFSMIVLILKLEHVLQREMGKELSHKLMTGMKGHYVKIDKRKPEQRGIMAFHRAYLIMGLSLYYAMQDELGPSDDLVPRIHKILWEGRMRQLVSILTFFVRRSKDPYNLFLRILGPKNERLFPCPPWDKSEVQIENGIGWHQNKCPYSDFFKEEGVLPLTEAYCDGDKRIAELVSDHIELKRERTLAKGNMCCDFYYIRK